MEIAILSRNENLYSTQRLCKAARQLGHKVTVIDYLRCYMNISSEDPNIHYKGKRLHNFDAIIPRIGSKRTFYGTAIVRQFETCGPAKMCSQNFCKSIQVYKSSSSSSVLNGFLF